MALPEIIKDIEARIIRPTSADNAIVRFDGTVGQVQNSAPLIDDNGTITFAIKAYQTNNVAGYYADQYGNFFHSRASTTDHWQIHSYDQSISLKYYPDTGALNIPTSVTAPTFIGALNGNATSATIAASATKATQDGNGNIISSTYLPLTGGTMGSGAVIGFTGTTGSISPNDPMTITYGRISCYGTLYINANTDNSGTEYVLLTAGKGLSSTLNDGLAIGTSTLTWQGANVFTSAGGVLEGELSFPTIATWPTASGETYPIESYGISWAGSSDTARIFYRVTASDAGNLVLRTGDDANCSIIFENSANGILGRVSQTGIYGAVWNDYAEYRDQITPISPGYCVASTDSGEVYKTSTRLQACDGIVSDTFGFAIGETDDCKTPLAVAGRVLAYCEGNKYDYHAGDTVCATNGGLVTKMTRDEIKEYPDRIVGIVSEIPEYETWGTGNVNVDNRIWIKVK